MGHCGDEGVGRRPAGATARQSSDLRSERDAIDDYHDANACERDMSAMQMDFPFRFDSSGRTAAADDENHIRDLIEQVLFTAPGERVNRPSFGSGLMQLVFAPNSDALAAATQMAVHGALQQWLGDVVLIEAVDVGHEEAVLRVSVRYTVRRTQERRVSELVRPI
jgi:phage baseplate assembly protein W